MGRIKVELMLDLETVDFIRRVSELSGESKDTVVNVILASQLIRLEDRSGRTKKATDKKSNGRSPKKQRVAKRK
jgi:hypothetical protein